MLSDMFSYFSILLYNLLNAASSFIPKSSRTIPNIRCIRSENDCISFCASSTESSGVFMKPAVMKCRRKSSSSSTFFGFITQHTNLSI